MLNKILAHKKEEVRRLATRPIEEEIKAASSIPRYPFVDALRHPKRTSALIAELKKASPSKGVIRMHFDPVQIALSYQAAGADALSILTDVRFFQGNPVYIRQVKEQVSLPVLRKDFIIDSLQIKESVALGADAVLLIAKALPIEDLVALYKEAEQAGMDCLIEVADKRELEQVLAHLHPPVIGINNRDLVTFQTDPNRTKDLLPYVPEDILVISESGIHSPKIVKDLEACGVSGFLVGEHFMRQDDVESAVRSLYGET